MAINEKVLTLSAALKQEMTLSPDKSIITISEQGIVEALKQNDLTMETVNKVHDATKEIVCASLHAAGEIFNDNVLHDEELNAEHNTTFHMNQFATHSFTHAFNRLGNGEVEMYTVYEQDLEGTDYKAISHELKERFKVVL